MFTLTIFIGNLIKVRHITKCNNTLIRIKTHKIKFIFKNNLNTYIYAKIFKMGNSQSMQKINYEDMQTVVKNSETYLLINTLPPSEQHCLISHTIAIDKEEIIINKYIRENKSIRIIVYGRNCNDETVQTKYQQLLSLGFYNIYVYLGGIFEWLLLQDIYGKELFPTTKRESDLLKFKPMPILNICLLENY